VLPPNGEWDLILLAFMPNVIGKCNAELLSRSHVLPPNGEWDLILLAFMPNVIGNQDGAEKGISTRPTARMTRFSTANYTETGSFLARVRMRASISKVKPLPGRAQGTST